MPEHLRDYHYEVVVLGGGPAGIAAACAAAESGCRVALLESTPWLGGPLWRTLPDEHLPRPARFWLDRLSHSTVEVFDRTTAFAVTNPDVLHAERGDEALHIGWNKLILATGAGVVSAVPGLDVAQRIRRGWTATPGQDRLAR